MIEATSGQFYRSQDFNKVNHEMIGVE